MFQVRVDGGGVTAERGPAEHADLLVRATPTVLADVGAGELPLLEALSKGSITVEGPPEVLEQGLAIFRPAWGVEPGDDED